MFELNALSIIWCAVALILGGTVKGALGIGIPLVSVPLLALVMQVPQAVALMPIPILIANVWQAFYGGYFFATVRRFWPVIIPLIIGTVFGAKILAIVEPHLLYGVVGLIVIVFSLTGHFQPQFRLPVWSESWLAPFVGLASGVLGGLSTMYGPPLVMFLVSLRLSKDEFVGTIATLYLSGVIPLTLALGAFEVMGRQELIASAVATVPLFVGVFLGQILRTRLKEESFRKGLLIVLLFIGLSLIGRAVL